MVLKSFENEVANSDKEVFYYFLDLIAHRPISNKIAEDFGITHQSPQMIVLENGKANFRTITTGVRDSSSVEILTGIKAGDTIIISGLMTIKPNAPVSVSTIKP